MNKVCAVCLLMQTFVSGIIGYFAGVIMQELGFLPSTSSAVAGVFGLWGAQTMNFISLLLYTRYR